MDPVTEPHRDTLIQEWIDCAERLRGTPECRLSTLAFTRLLEGQSVPVAELRGTLDLDATTFAALVTNLVARGRLTLDAAGTAITGAGGLSVVPSRHQLTLNGRQFYTWCVLDAVGIPAALGTDARVESRCADTGEPVWLEFAAGELTRRSHAQLHVSLVAPDLTRSTCDGICTDIVFYSTAELSAGHRGTLATVEDVIALGRQCWTEGVPL